MMLMHRYSKLVLTYLIITLVATSVLTCCITNIFDDNVHIMLHLIAYVQLIYLLLCHTDL